jgi:hypothetical protein
MSFYHHIQQARCQGFNRGLSFLNDFRVLFQHLTAGGDISRIYQPISTRVAIGREISSYSANLRYDIE